MFRYAFRERAREEIAKRPSWRAIERTIAKDGLKTVFVLRLSPLLPIPIGAYNYLYGAMPVTVSDFIIGLSAASVKPYFLDSYLGVYGKSIMDGNGAQNDLLFGAVLFILILVGMYVGICIFLQRSNVTNIQRICLLHRTHVMDSWLQAHYRHN